MKWIAFLFVLISFSSFAISHKEFVKLPREKRAEVISAYRDFIREYSRSIQVTSVEKNSFPEFFEAAFAAGENNCLFAGWPSQRINGKCSTPRSNPAYQKESCGEGQMPCQPLLFGRGICTESATSDQKSRAFTNCEKKFQYMGKDLASVVEYISDPELSQQADELFQLVDQVCQSGVQATTAMCARLKSRVDQIKALRIVPPQPQQARVEQGPPQVALTVATKEALQLNSAVQDLHITPRCESCEAQRAQTMDDHQTVQIPAPTPAKEDFIPFPRIDSGYDLAACGSSRNLPDGYSIDRIFNCVQESQSVPSGFTFRPGPGNPFTTGMVSKYPDGSPPGRMMEIVSRNQAFNETYLILEEYAGGPDSHDVKSYMFIIPRVTVPSVKVEGSNLVVTLASGEKVMIDKVSRAITGGALTEGPLDLTTDRFQRKPPNIHYAGKGISIRLDHRYEHPLTSSATATVQQGNRTCNVPRTSLFDNDGKMKSQSDAALVAVLNQSCPARGQPPFNIP